MNIEGGSGNFPDERREEDGRREAEERREVEERIRKDEEVVSSVGAMMKLGGEVPFQPTSEANIPDIRMEKGMERDPREEKLRENQRNLEKQGRLRSEEDDSYWRADSYLKRMIVKMRLLGQENQEEGEKDLIKEEMMELYENMKKSEMLEINHMVNETVLRYRNPHPYDSREEQSYVCSSLIKITEKASFEFKNNPEAMVWLKKIREDALWGQSVINIMEGVGPMVQGFWSWKQILDSVRGKVRKDPEASDYEKVFFKELKGLKYTDKEKALLPEGLVGLREKAIGYQDDSYFWRTAVPAVQQLEYDKNEKVDVFVDMSSEEIMFVQLLFGSVDKDDWVEYKGKRFPKEINNIYTMSSKELGNREYRGLMEALVKLDVKNRLNKENFWELLEKVKKEAEKKLDSWYGFGNLEEDVMLADLVVKTGMVFDWGHGVVVDTGWGWKYEEVKGEIVRKRVEGGTTSAMDWRSAGCWLQQIVSDDNKDWTINPMWPKMSKEMKKLIGKSKSGFKPNWENIPNWKKDPELAELGEIKDRFDKDLRGQEALKELLDYGWSKEEKKWLEDNVWYWDTGVRGIVIPIFFPPMVEGMNFLKTISLEGEGEIQRYERDEKEEYELADPTVWKELREGKKFSEMDWRNMKNQKVYQWMITLGQMINVFTVLLQDKTKLNENDFEKLLGSSKKRGELIKRSELSFREGEESKAMKTMSYVSLITALYTAEFKADILGKSGNLKDNQTQFVSLMSDWYDEFKGMNEKGDGMVDKHYADGIVEMMLFYAKTVGRWGYVLGDEKIKDKGKNFDIVRNAVSGFVKRPYGTFYDLPLEKKRN